MGGEAGRAPSGGLRSCACSRTGWGRHHHHNVLKRISQLRRFYRIHIRIQKSCRIPVSEALAETIDRTITSASNTDWNNFVSFPILALGVPISPNNAGSSLSSVIRANQKRLTQSPFDLSTLCQHLPCHQARRESSPSENLRSHVNTKLMLNDIKAAIRVVSSDDTVLEVTPEVLQALILRYPSEPEDSVTPIIPAENIVVTADEKKIIRSLRSFSGSCCGGNDGLRPAHLLDIVAVSTAEAGLHLRRSITNFTIKILRGDVSDYAVKLFFPSNLTALIIIIIIIIMVIFKCYFSGELIVLSLKKFKKNNNNDVNI